MNTPAPTAPAALPQTGVFGPGIQPFGTGDAILAFSLRLAGLPFVDERMPLQNLYDEDILKGIKGMDFRGLTLEAAVKKAFAAEKRGQIRYLFQRAEELGSLLKAYEDEQHIVATYTGDAAERLQEIMRAAAAGEMSAHEALLRIACVTMKMRVQFMNMWKELTPFIRVWSEGESSIRDGTIETRDGPRPCKVVSNPGFKIVPLNASPGLRKEMGL
jgi:hypothetical protein